MHRLARSPLLAPGLLDGHVVAVAGRTGGLGRAAAQACGALGAHVEQLGDEGHRVDFLDEAAVGAAMAAIAAPEQRLDVVVIDAASAFAAARLTRGAASDAEHGAQTVVSEVAPGALAVAPEAVPGVMAVAPLRATTAMAWVVARAAATRVMIAASKGGKLVVLAPAPDAGPHAEAARVALENFSRTLSIEWSRHDIRLTTVAPGRRTTADELAALVAYLASPAGDYFSGCRFSLGEVEA